jgi:hypothetical protein
MPCIFFPREELKSPVGLPNGGTRSASGKTFTCSTEQDRCKRSTCTSQVESTGLNSRRGAIRNSRKERAREEAPPVAVTVITPSRSTSSLHQRITGHRSIDHLLLCLQHMTLLILPTCMFHETILVFHLCACATKHMQICTPLMS